MKFKTIVMNQRHADTVLAALRLYEAMLRTGEPIPDHIRAIAEDHGDRLAAREIDALCIRINKTKELE